MAKHKTEGLYLNVFNMKNLLTSLFVLVGTTGLLAQDLCSTYYPMKKGTTFQITTYEKDSQKPSGVLNYEVKDAGSDWALFFFEMTDQRDKVVATSEYEIKCEDDGVSIDFSSLGSPAALEQYKGMEVEVTGTNMFIPNNLSDGQTLPDSNMVMTVNMGIKLRLTVDVFNRQVVGSETITTPAGTFDCKVLSYDFESKMGIKVRGSSKQWLAKGIGAVKQEDRNKKGKITSWSQLTAFSN